MDRKSEIHKFILAIFLFEFLCFTILLSIKFYLLLLSLIIPLSPFCRMDTQIFLKNRLHKSVDGLPARIEYREEPQDGLLAEEDYQIYIVSNHKVYIILLLFSSIPPSPLL